MPKHAPTQSTNIFARQRKTPATTITNILGDLQMTLPHTYIYICAHFHSILFWARPCKSLAIN